MHIAGFVPYNAFCHSLCISMYAKLTLFKCPGYRPTILLGLSFDDF